MLELGYALRLAGLLLFATAFGCAAAGQDPAAVVVIFDGSGSMHAEFPATRTQKVSVAREALQTALAKPQIPLDVGLVGFGHRRGDCGDVEVLLAPQPLDVERVMAPLATYNPRGRGPLTAALREAGRLLAGRPGSRSIVLIHDDADNCRVDLCAAAGELKAAGITAHDVGLNLKPVDVPKMACLTQLTGGTFTNATTPEQLTAALEGALLASGGAAHAEPSEASPAAPVGPVASDAPAGLYLRAALGATSAPLGLPLHWSVREADAGGSLLFDARAVAPMVPVGKGRYRVEVREGAVAARQVVEVEKEAPTVAVLVLDAGSVHVRALLARSGAPASEAAITILGADADARPVAFFGGGEGTAMLPAGRYLVRAAQGLVRSERALVVPAGSQGRLDVSLNGARVLLNAVLRDPAGSGEPAPGSIVFSVAEDDPDAPKGRRELARSAGPQAEFMLAPGTYYVLARQGGIEARERIAVAGGDVVRRTLTLAPGRLALASRPIGGTPAVNEPVSYRIERLDGPAGEAILTSRPSPVLLLNGGRYRVESRYGAMNVRTTREVEVKPGQSQQLVFEPQAATLRLRLVGTAAPGEVFWDVRDAAGHAVWTTSLVEPSATLQVGRYLVRADVRGRSVEREIELRAGEARVLELSAP
jgi:Ca-activated chloride channel family protein